MNDVKARFELFLKELVSSLLEAHAADAGESTAADSPSKSSEYMDRVLKQVTALTVSYPHLKATELKKELEPLILKYQGRLLMGSPTPAKKPSSKERWA